VDPDHWRLFAVICVHSRLIIDAGSNPSNRIVTRRILQGDPAQVGELVNRHLLGDDATDMGGTSEVDPSDRRMAIRRSTTAGASLGALLITLTTPAGSQASCNTEPIGSFTSSTASLPTTGQRL
jgi:hypothetical protein